MRTVGNGAFIKSDMAVIFANILQLHFEGAHGHRIKINHATSVYYMTKGSIMQSIIHTLKYKNNKEVGIWIGNVYGNSLKNNKHYKDVDYLIPIPLHIKKLRLRGYNQSKQFAIGLSQSMHKPVIEIYGRFSAIDSLLRIQSNKIIETLEVEHLNKLKNEKVKLLAYQEKRQSTSYFINGECKNLELLGTSIKDAIKKTEKDNNITIDKVVINYPFGELFFYENKLTYKRDHERHLITKDELQHILEKTEKIIIQKCFKNIEQKSGYIEADLKLIISSIINMRIDTHPYEKIIGEA